MITNIDFLFLQDCFITAAITIPSVISDSQASVFNATLIFYWSCLILPMMAIFLFIFIGQLTVELFCQMKNEVEHIAGYGSISEGMEKLLGRWKRNYLLLTELTSHLNTCFGFVLLQSLVFAYVHAINCAFYLFLTIKLGSSFVAAMYVLQIAKSLIYFSFLCWIPSKIKREVQRDTKNKNGAKLTNNLFLIAYVYMATIN